MRSGGRLRTRLMTLLAFGVGVSCSGEGCSKTGAVTTLPSQRRIVDSVPAAARGQLACALSEPFDAAVRYSRTLHVSMTGNDSSPGTDREPLCTIGAAARRASPGTRIVVHAGTYRGSSYLDRLQGTPQAPIAIVGDGEVVLDGGGEANVLLLVDPRYLVLENLTLQNASNNGLHINDGGTYDTPAQNVVLRRIRVRNIGTGGNHDCMKLSGLDRLYLVDSDLSGCNSGEAVDMVGCHDGVIRNNVFHDLPNNAIVNKGGSSNNLIHGNRFVDVGGRAVSAGGSTALEFFRPADARYEAANIRIVANVLVRSAHPIVFSNCDGCQALNNTIVDPRSRVVRILQETVDNRFVPCRRGQFKNNIVVFQSATINGPEKFANVGADTEAETFVFESNLWFATDDARFGGPILPGPISPETGSVSGKDPGFVDPASGNYRIRSSSPAARTGRPARNAHADFDGRCWAVPPAIGAFQP